MSACTTKTHDALRNSASAFAGLAPVGLMADRVDDEFPVRLDTYAMANCRCGSTLARLISSEILSGSTVLS